MADDDAFFLQFRQQDDRILPLFIDLLHKLFIDIDKEGLKAPLAEKLPDETAADIARPHDDRPCGTACQGINEAPASRVSRILL